MFSHTGCCLGTGTCLDFCECASHSGYIPIYGMCVDDVDYNNKCFPGALTGGHGPHGRAVWKQQIRVSWGDLDKKTVFTRDLKLIDRP